MNSGFNSYGYYPLRTIPDLVANLATEHAKMYHGRSHNLPGHYLKYYNQYQAAPYVSHMYGNFYPKQRYTPYTNRFHAGSAAGSVASGTGYNQSNQLAPHYLSVQPNGSINMQGPNKSLNSSLNSSGSDSGKNSTFYSSNTSNCSNSSASTYSSNENATGPIGSVNGVSTIIALPPVDHKEAVVLQISNLDPSIEEQKMQQYLLCQLKPITPILSLAIESPSLAKVRVPNAQCAKQVVSHLHRKKVGHKRMVVSYIKDPSSAESSALRCQVAGLLKDVPYYSLPINKFRELFQSRFKSSISVLDLYRMGDVCSINLGKNDDKIICLQPELISSLQSNPLVESSQHSVPYCIYHFQQEAEKGWAEQEIEPLPCVNMSVSELQTDIYLLLKNHKNDIPVASILYCIEGELQKKIVADDSGVPLEHLLCCIKGVQVTNNSFGIKVLSWLDHELNSPKDNEDSSNGNVRYLPKSPTNDYLQQISREVVELIKMSPKSTMKFTRFIPAYHNHFGKQCRVADYGYTRLIELFEALAPVVQVMGDGENRQITLTHRTQLRRFTNDVLKILRAQPSKTLPSSQLAQAFAQTYNRPFEVTDYGVCHVYDLLSGLVYGNSIAVQSLDGDEFQLSVAKRKPTPAEMDKTACFAAEAIELFRTAPQYTILFKKFVRSYHYHFGHQCRLSDYGLTKLTELIEAVTGIVEMEQSNDEDRKIYLNYRVSQRIFAEQIHDIIKYFTGNRLQMMRLSEVLNFHKNKFGYHMQPCCLGHGNMFDAIKALPYVELFEVANDFMIISHLDNPLFRQRSYAASIVFVDSKKERFGVAEYLRAYQQLYKQTISEKQIVEMKHALVIELDKCIQTVTMTPLMKFIVRIVQVLKARSPITLYDLKLALNISFGTCFEFGFPHLLSLLNAYPDVFTIENVCYIPDRRDIELNRDCIFAKSFHTLEAAMAAPMSGAPKMPVNGGKCRSALPSNSRQPSNMCYSYGQPQPQPSSMAPPPMKPLQPFPLPGQCNQPLLPGPFYPNNRTNSLMVNGNVNSMPPLLPSVPSMMPSSSTSTNTQNLQQMSAYNMMNVCLNRFSALSLKQSQQQLVESNALGSIDTKSTFIGSTSAGPCTPMSSGTTFKPAEQHMDTSGRMVSCFKLPEPLSAYQDPPKPDTPPVKALPYWLDPTWKYDSYFTSTDWLSTEELLNIPLPELKTFDEIPEISTPVIMEKLGKHPAFQFDSE